MTKLIVDSEDLIDVADTIRTKGGTSEALEWPDDYVDAVDAISGGGGGGGTTYLITSTGSTSKLLGIMTPYDGTVAAGDTVYIVLNVNAKNSPTAVNDTTSGSISVRTSVTGAMNTFDFTMPASNVTVTIN